MPSQPPSSIARCFRTKSQPQHPNIREYLTSSPSPPTSTMSCGLQSQPPPPTFRVSLEAASLSRSTVLTTGSGIPSLSLLLLSFAPRCLDQVRRRMRTTEWTSEKEFRNGHVEDSINVPYVFFTSQGKEKNPQFIKQVEAHFDEQDNIVVGCKSGVRSELACIDLLAAGFKNVKNIEGGYDAWVENGFAVKKPQAQDEL